MNRIEAAPGAELGFGEPRTAEPGFGVCLRLLSALALGLVIGALVPAQGSHVWAADSAPPRQLYLPLVATASAPCPVTSNQPYSFSRILGEPAARPAAESPDLNLALRGHAPTAGHIGLLDLGGPTDSDPPQLPALFSPARLPAFRSLHQVYAWEWSCGEEGCRGQPIAWPPVTLLEVAAHAGETLHLPSRRAQIHEDGHVALVLYAEERRLTLAYTREDSPAVGFLVHLEEICVDANLLALYRRLDEEGRRVLPALRNGDPVGCAHGDALKVAMRDSGSFMEPRSRKDWWQGY